MSAAWGSPRFTSVDIPCGAFQPVFGPLLGDKAASFGFAIAFVAFWWLLMWALARRGWLISV